MIPITVIGGYLGAGKTTLINHVLRYAGGERIAVLVNEFGELAIDADLIEAESEDVIAITGGCICCSFGDNLVGKLMDLSALSPPPDHILVEASGVAIPGAIAASLSLLQDVRLNGLAVLADAETVQEGAKDRYLGDTILRQLQDADLVLMTKTDLLDSAAIEPVRSWLESVVRGTAIVQAPHGKVSLAVLLGPSHARQGYRAAQHGDPEFESLVIELNKPVDAPALASRLAGADLGIVRAKGFAGDAAGATRLIQVVGRRFDVSTVATTESHALVCIGRAGLLRPSELRKVVLSCEL